MTDNLKSDPNGALNAETTEPLSVMPSTDVENQSTSDMWDFTPKEKNQKDSQPTSNLRDEPATFVRIVQAFAAKLGALVEWRKVVLGDGREVYALCFPLSLWDVDPVSKALKPR